MPPRDPGFASTVRIRPVTPQDAPAVKALLAELGYPGTGPFLAEHLRSLAAGDADEVIVAEAEEGVLGVLALHFTPIPMHPRPFARITALSVTDAARGRGVGRALLEAAEAAARAAGAPVLEVTCSLPRTGAHAFYARMGLEEYPKYFRKELGPCAS